MEQPDVLAPLREALENVREIQEGIHESLEDVMEKLSSIDVDSQKVFQEEIHAILHDINTTELAVEHRLLRLEKGHTQDQQDCTMTILSTMAIWGVIVYFFFTKVAFVV